MSKVIASLEKVLLPFAVKIGKQPHVNAIKNGFIKLMPLTLAGAMFVLINNVFLSFGEGSFFYSLGIRLDASTIETLNGFKAIGGNVYNGTLGIMSLMAPFFIGSALAEERRVDPMAAGLLAVAAFMTVTPYSVGEAYAVGANWLGGANIISGIVIGLVVAEMFTFIVHRNWVITLPSSVPASVSRSFSAVIPAFIILSIMGIISWALTHWGTNFHQIIMDTISTPLASLGSVVGWAYLLFVPLLWFFGIHGSLALTALEYRLLLLFAQSRGKLVTREHVRNAIWDSAGEYVSDNTLNVYVKRLRDKIEDDPADPKLVLTMRGLGYKAGPVEEGGAR